MDFLSEVDSRAQLFANAHQSFGDISSVFTPDATTVPQYLVYDLLGQYNVLTAQFAMIRLAP